MPPLLSNNSIFWIALLNQARSDNYKHKYRCVLQSASISMETSWNVPSQVSPGSESKRIPQQPIVNSLPRSAGACLWRQMWHNSWSSVVDALNGRHPLTPTLGRSNRFGLSSQTAPHLLFLRNRAYPDRNDAAGRCREAHVCEPNEHDAVILAALLNQVLGVKSSDFRRKENWKF